MDEYKQLYNYLNAFQDTPEEILSEYVNSWEEFSLSKKDNVLAPGQTQKYLYFIFEGVVKSYFEKDGKEYIVSFGHDSLLGDMKSLNFKRPSDVTIECITDCKFLRIYYDTHLELLDKHKELMKLYKVGTEMLFIGFIDRYNILMSSTIEERFTAFAQRSTYLLNVIPHKDLASYLRIDKTNFSKLLNTIQI